MILQYRHFKLCVPFRASVRSSSFPTGNAILAPLVESDRCYLTLLTPKVLFRFYELQKTDNGTTEF